MPEQEAVNIKLDVDRSNLYREEVFSDLRACTIRRLIPVKPDGSEDKSRNTLYVGQTHLVSPNGPIPIQNVIKVKDLQQAFKKFPEAMQEAMERMIEEAKKIQRQEDSRIIVPGR